VLLTWEAPVIWRKTTALTLRSASTTALVITTVHATQVMKMRLGRLQLVGIALISWNVPATHVRTMELVQKGYALQTHVSQITHVPVRLGGVATIARRTTMNVLRFRACMEPCVRSRVHSDRTCPGVHFHAHVRLVLQMVVVLMVISASMIFCVL
jgi:hypothetical protein